LWNFQERQNMAESNDPRVYFAAERTMLAWLRTGIAVIGVGFIVARFGLFLRMMRNESATPPPGASTLLGVGFVLLGATGIAFAAWQFAHFLKTLSASDRPAGYWMTMATWYSAVVAVLGLALAAYLLWGLEAR
jgi:putative membrane protein